MDGVFPNLLIVLRMFLSSAVTNYNIFQLLLQCVNSTKIIGIIIMLLLFFFCVTFVKKVLSHTLFLKVDSQKTILKI